MNNPNLNLENTIRQLNDQIRKETQALEATRFTLEHATNEDARLEAEIKMSEDKIKALTAEIGGLKQLISNDQRKIDANKGTEHKLKQDLETEKRLQGQNAQKLADAKRDFDSSLKQSGIKIR